MPVTGTPDATAHESCAAGAPRPLPFRHVSGPPPHRLRDGQLRPAGGPSPIRVGSFRCVTPPARDRVGAHRSVTATLTHRARDASRARSAPGDVEPPSRSDRRAASMGCRLRTSERERAAQPRRAPARSPGERSDPGTRPSDQGDLPSWRSRGLSAVTYRERAGHVAPRRGREAPDRNAPQITPPRRRAQRSGARRRTRTGSAAVHDQPRERARRARQNRDGCPADHPAHARRPEGPSTAHRRWAQARSAPLDDNVTPPRDVASSLRCARPPGREATHRFTYRRRAGTRASRQASGPERSEGPTRCPAADATAAATAGPGAATAARALPRAQGRGGVETDAGAARPEASNTAAPDDDIATAITGSAAPAAPTNAAPARTVGRADGGERRAGASAQMSPAPPTASAAGAANTAVLGSPDGSGSGRPPGIRGARTVGEPLAVGRTSVGAAATSGGRSSAGGRTARWPVSGGDGHADCDSNQPLWHEVRRRPPGRRWRDSLGRSPPARARRRLRNRRGRRRPTPRKYGPQELPARRAPSGAVPSGFV